MPTLNVKEKSYEFSLQEIKQLIAKDLNFNVKNIDVNYNIILREDAVDGKTIIVPQIVAIVAKNKNE